MKAGIEILEEVLKTTQLSEVCIRCALDSSMRPNLRTVLERQLHELDSIETEALSIAAQRGWDLIGTDPAICFFTDRMIRLRLTGRNTDSRIAELMIQRNTKGMISGLKHLHQFSEEDAPIRILSQKLLDCETANIRHMHSFL